MIHEKVKFVALPNYASDKPPQKGTSQSAAYDLICSSDEPEVTLKSGELTMIPTGVKVELPAGYYMAVVPRSGFSTKNKVIIPNSPGTIDADFTGQMMIGLLNLNKDDVIVKRGDRLAQCMLHRMVDIVWEQVEHLKVTERGEGGFGSTGTK